MRANNVIITIDYETWHPIPAGYEINWKNDMIANTYQLMDICERAGAKLTLMVEVCEYMWLKEKGRKEIYLLIEQQLKDAVHRGHDVQLHMHPNWLPELGAKYEAGKWEWNWEYASCNEYPGDLTKLIYRCKSEIEKIVKEVNPSYEVCAFRAGAYRVQPFQRISEALIKNNIICDTSVYCGGKSRARGYNFTKCQYFNKPYWASTYDPQIEDKFSCKLIELPITVWRKDARWFLDNSEAKVFASRFLSLNHQYFSNNNNFFVLIGHSKGEHDYASIEQQLQIIKKYPGVRYTTISESISSIKKELEMKRVDYAEQSINEVKEIMNYIYSEIEPKNCNNGGRIERILLQGGTLCYGYALLLYSILKQYGYFVIRITLVAKNMPKGRGKRKIDSHEVVELELEGKKYVLDATTNRIIPYGLKYILKNPNIIKERKDKDERYMNRQYFTYDSPSFYKNVIYYTKTREYIYGIENEGIKQKMIRTLRNLLFHIIPSKLRFYNIFICM